MIRVSVFFGILQLYIWISYFLILSQAYDVMTYENMTLAGFPMMPWHMTSYVMISYIKVKESKTHIYGQRAKWSIGQSQNVKRSSKSTATSLTRPPSNTSSTTIVWLFYLFFSVTTFFSEGYRRYLALCLTWSVSQFVR